MNDRMAIGICLTSLFWAAACKTLFSNHSAANDSIVAGNAPSPSTQWQVIGSVAPTAADQYQLTLPSQSIGKVRLRELKTCSHFNFALWAFDAGLENVPMYFDSDGSAGQSNPLYRDHFFFVKSQTNASISMLMVETYNAQVEASCRMDMAVAKFPDFTPPADARRVFAEAIGFSTFSEADARALGTQRLQIRAQALCGGVHAVQVPGQSQCTVESRPHNYQAACRGWFVCMP